MPVVDAITCRRFSAGFGATLGGTQNLVAIAAKWPLDLTRLTTPKYPRQRPVRGEYQVIETLQFTLHKFPKNIPQAVRSGSPMLFNKALYWMGSEA